MSKPALPNPSFCFAPFTSIVQDYRGRSGPCPYQSGCWNFSNVPISKRWNHSLVSKMRKQFLKGQRPIECRRCFEEEAAGFKSHRQHENQNAQYSNFDIQQRTYLNGPKSLVLRLSNLCNLACRSCHSIDSSLFKEEGDFYAKSYGDKKNRYIEREARKEFSEADLEEIMRISSNLTELNFYGGEPMINKSHELLLHRLVKEQNPAKIRLFYCTNGTHLPSDERVNLWKKFQNVHLNFSIDATGAGFELMRWPAKWDTVLRNMVFIRDTLSKEMSISCGVGITVSAMNIYNLPEIYSELDSLFPNQVGLTTVHDPIYFSVIHLPTRVKQLITDKLLASPYSGKFQGIVNYMNTDQMEIDVWRQFVLWTEKMDAYRGQQFSKVFPEYFEILSEYYSRYSTGIRIIRP